tara:strand:+ start:1015 stop:3015 length:2001 start_codon:yes stop_codon:yes gene_type:complete
LLCSYSYSSLAYDQQYNVGDTGPNGGTVTSVDVTSVVTGTEVGLNGGFEETTTTTLFTETVIEQISTSEQQTVTTTTAVETTTANQLGAIDTSNGWSTQGTVSVGSGTCSYSGTLQTGEACVGPQANVPNSNASSDINWQPNGSNSLGGGQVGSEYVEITQLLTEAEIQAGFDVNYGVTVESHKSNATVGVCSATNGDCKDLIKVSIYMYAGAPAGQGGTRVASLTHRETLTYSGTQTYAYNYTIPQNEYESVWAKMNLWGVDAGYHQQMFGPIFSDPYIKLTYDAITSVTETITNIILSNQETVFNSEESILTSVYIGDPVADTVIEPINYAEVESFEIEIVDSDGGGVELEFTVEVDETANVATVEMSSTNLETGVVQVEQIAEVTLVASLDSFDSGSTTVDMPSVESIEADVGAQVDVAVADAIAEIEVPAVEVEVEVETTTTETTEPTAEVEVNTSEASSQESTTAETETSTEEASEGSESTQTETDENTTETDQESSSDVEQSVDKSGEESEGSDSGESDAGGDTKESKTESKADDKGKSGDAKKGNASKRTESKQQKAKRIKEAVDKAKQKIATRILAAMADTYSAINEATKIALMSSLTDQENFKAYLDKQNALPLDWYTSEQIYADMPQLLDPAGILYDMAQDKIMDEMIMQQYETQQ